MAVMRPEEIHVAAARLWARSREIEQRRPWPGSASPPFPIQSLEAETPSIWTVSVPPPASLAARRRIELEIVVRRYLVG
jgi:hypothetical protein